MVGTRLTLTIPPANFQIILIGDSKFPVGVNMCVVLVTMGKPCDELATCAGGLQSNNSFGKPLPHDPVCRIIGDK